MYFLADLFLASTLFGQEIFDFLTEFLVFKLLDLKLLLEYFWLLLFYGKLFFKKSAVFLLFSDLYLFQLFFSFS